MIATLRLENFQSHPDTVLDLHPGINAIVGASDKGKSAILRGLLWAVENRPSGDAHISDWCKTEKGTIKADQVCRVTVTKRDGSTCSRIRSAKMNGYMVGDTKVEAIKTDVPAEASEFFNLTEVNIQRQRDIDFLISKSPGDVAKFFNKLINLEVIDKALSISEAKKRASAGNIKVLGNEIEGLLGQLDRLSWVGDAEELLGKMELEQANLSEIEDKVISLQNSLAQIEIQNTRINELSWVESAQVSVGNAKKLANILATSANQYNQLTTMVDSCKRSMDTAEKLNWVGEVAPILAEAKGLSGEVTKASVQVYDLSTLLSSLKRDTETLNRIPSGEPERLAQRIPAMKTRKTVVLTDFQELSLLCTQLEEHQGKIVSAEATIAELEAKRPQSCPLCGGPYNKSHQEPHKGVSYEP